MSKVLKYSKVFPGGNTTLLVYNRLPRKYQPQIAKAILDMHRDTEQVGFIEPATNPKAVCRLQMMGGEFCGNATRSLVYLIANHVLSNSGEHREEKEFVFDTLKTKMISSDTVLVIPVEVSGVDSILKASVTVERQGDDYTILDIIVPMPFRKPVDSIENRPSIFKDEPDIEIVHMDGISHALIPVQGGELPDCKDEAKTKAYSLLLELGLTKLEACGVIYYSVDGDVSRIEPFVYVRDTETLYYETACGSGTIAYALAKAKKCSESVELDVRQPSNRVIKASVVLDGDKFTSASISGDIQLIEEFSLRLPKESNLISNVTIDRVTSSEMFDKYSHELGRIYREVFSDPPYCERFTDKDAIAALRTVFETDNGILYIALDGEDVIGFGGGLPLTNFPEICEVVKGKIDSTRAFYMAELGVDYPYRGEGISHKLVDARILQIPDGFDTVIVRTSVDNIRTQHLYRGRRAFKILNGTRQQVINYKYYPGASEAVEEPDERLFLVLDRKTAVDNIVAS